MNAAFVAERQASKQYSDAKHISPYAQPIPMKMPTYQQAAISVPPVQPPQYMARPAALPFSPAPAQYAPQPTSFTPAPIQPTFV